MSLLNYTPCVMFGLNHQQLTQSFPFHLVVNSELRIVQFGHSFTRLGLGLNVGAPLTDHFQLKRPRVPFTYEKLAATVNVAYTLQATANKLLFRYQLLIDHEQELIFWLGSPLIRQKDDFKKYGLKLNDFALHDALPDFLTVLGPQAMLLDETKQLAQRLRQNQVELEEAKAELEMRVLERTTELRETVTRLEEANQFKSQFITTVSHELRTPLNAINGFAELILKGLSGEVDDQVHADVQLIHDNGQRLLSLINAILDISQIEAKPIHVIPEPFLISELIDQVASENRSLLQFKPIELHTETSPPDLAIYADRTRIQQTLVNLLNNAIKFTARGRISIQAMHIHPMVKIMVTDTGIGIPPDKLEVIFEDFQQVDMSDTRVYGGTGLGLSICRRLVHLHGGDIGVDSQLDQGSTFWFTLPHQT